MITIDNFNKFLKEIHSESVYLKPSRLQEYDKSKLFTFDVVIKGDKYLDPERTQIGLTNQFYEDVDRVAIRLLGIKPSWNNTAHIGWFIAEGQF